MSFSSSFFFFADFAGKRWNARMEYLKYNASKKKEKDTEEVDKWNHGDSIMGVYAKYMTTVAQTVTPAELLGFLEM